MSRLRRQRRWYRPLLLLVLAAFVHCQVAAAAGAGAGHPDVGARDAGAECHAPDDDPAPAASDTCPLPESVPAGLVLPVCHPPLAGAGFPPGSGKEAVPCARAAPGLAAGRACSLSELCRLLI